MNIQEMISNEILTQFKDKINKNESIDDYYNSFTKKQLLYLISPYCINKNIGEFLLLKTKQKKEIIKYILNNLKDVYKYALLNLTEKSSNAVKNILTKNDCNETMINYLICHNALLFKLNYTNNCLDSYIPLDLSVIIINLLSESSIKEAIKRNTKIMNNFELLLNVYGILEINDYIDINNKVFKEKINIDDIFNIILMAHTNERDLSIMDYEDTKLIYKEFLDEEDKFYEFYQSLDDSLDYKIYTAKEYEDIYNFKYFYQLKEYKDIINYMNKEYYIDDEEYLKEFFIDDTIYYLMDSKEKLNDILEDKLYVLCESVTKKQIKTLEKMFEELNKYIPKFYLKGNK